MPQSTFRAAGYRRVSMRERVDGHSLDAQETNIRQYVAAQNWSFTGLYTDAVRTPANACFRKAISRLLVNSV